MRGVVNYVSVHMLHRRRANSRPPRVTAFAFRSNVLHCQHVCLQSPADCRMKSKRKGPKSRSWILAAPWFSQTLHPAATYLVEVKHDSTHRSLTRKTAHIHGRFRGGTAFMATRRVDTPQLYHTVKGRVWADVGQVNSPSPALRS
jgi:hypothetical protein